MTESITYQTNYQGVETQKTSNPLTKGMGKDEFMKLLTIQLKNQSPMKPYDNMEFASQLALFSQLEQLNDIRSLLEQQTGVNQALSQTISNTALPGLLGKSASAATGILRYDGENQVNFGYSLSGSATKGDVAIKDEAGRVIRNISLTGTDLASGSHKIRWDGKDNNGNLCPAGKYKTEVTISTAGGSTYQADTFVYGKIQSVKFKPEGTVLIINDMEIPLNSVNDITLDN